MDLIFLFLNIISTHADEVKLKKNHEKIHSSVRQYYDKMVYSCSLVSHLGEGQSFFRLEFDWKWCH